MDTITFIQKAQLIHNNKYDYSLVNYVKSIEKVLIICPEHGIFQQTPHIHLLNHGCSECGKRHKHDKSSWIAKAQIVHGDKYDYSESEYMNSRTSLIIICPLHGRFEQNAHSHLRGWGCKKCIKYKGFDNQVTTTKESFINDSFKVHGNLYDYSSVEYKNCRHKVIIKCKIHGEFSQTPTCHKLGQGCPKCKHSSGEKKIMDWLSLHQISYINEHKFKDCKNKLPLRFDFYLNDYNTCIEFDGLQHFSPISWSNTYNKINSIEKFKNTQICDNIKNNYCVDNSIKLIRIPYWDLNNIDEILDKELSEKITKLFETDYSVA